MLSLGVIKNRRTILFTDIGTLPVHLSRVMAFPENLEEVIVAGLKRVKSHLDRFCMTGIMTADILICRVFSASSAITDTSGASSTSR